MTRRQTGRKPGKTTRKTTRAHTKTRPRTSHARKGSPRVAAVGSKELTRLRRQIERHARGVPLRWNPDPKDVRRSVVKLVLTLVELIRKLMERQAIRRMEARTLTRQETEAVGRALMELERTIREIGQLFDLTPEDLNIDLGVVKLM